jgi:hypothetical protein
VLNYRGGGRFQAFSGGSDPKGKVHHPALEMLSRHRIPVERLESKSWTVFAILLFISLKLDALDELALKRQLDEIGSTTVPRS